MQNFKWSIRLLAVAAFLTVILGLHTWYYAAVVQVHDYHQVNLAERIYRH